jgi:aminopeptidase N
MMLAGQPPAFQRGISIMNSPTPAAVHLEDYAVPAFLVPRIEMDIDLFEDDARVRAKLDVQRNPEAADPAHPLLLDVDELTIESVVLDGMALTAERYRLDERRLTIPNVADAFELVTTCRINPAKNTKLMGIFTSSTGFFSLCEAEGFRRITPFPDRPDVMARYKVTLHADRQRYPVLLANGNLIAHGEESEGRHWATWEDPFPKPSYLFAVVAARLDRRSDTFVTRSGRKVLLQFFVEPGKLDQGTFALEALKAAMRWDEETYGLEVDLDQYNVVAVGDFNAGAMENKGLNIFNTKLVLARPDISTDFDFYFIDRTVAHEYFHNWTGNRVTCRDWFQLSLKEGLTVFREQQYAADRYSAPVARIQTVRQLRSTQFPEDASPMAHPVRPPSYRQISNFYTSTVYGKGAEVVRMIHTLVGPKNFRKGIDRYFKRHDGHAVTTDDLVQDMQDASGVDLAQFKRWYDQSGTPRLSIRGHYDPASKVYELNVTQSCPPTAGQTEKLPFHLPLTVGLLDAGGEDIPLQLEGESSPDGTSRVLSVRQPQEVFRFVNVRERPVPSLGRDFSAPAIFDYDYSDEDLEHLLSFDSDPFNRWEAGQRVALNVLLEGVADSQAGREVRFPDALADAFGRVLAHGTKDPALAAEGLALPLEVYIGDQLPVVDPDAIHRVRHAMRRFLARRLEPELLATYEACGVRGNYSPDAVSAGRRALKNLCLAYLMDLAAEETRHRCVEQLNLADNMTDALAALTALASCDCPERLPALGQFYEKWQGEPLVVDKWLGVEALSRLPGTVTRVRELTTHPAFSLRNPNKVYALLGSFGVNQVNFHAADGSGYALMAEQILALDPINPQVTARMVRNFERWRRFDRGRQALMKAALERVAAVEGLSKEAAEVVARILDPSVPPASVRRSS